MTARQESDRLFMREVGRLCRVLHGFLEFENRGTPVELNAVASHLASMAVAVAQVRVSPPADLDEDVRAFVTDDAPTVLAKIGGLCTALARAETPAEVDAARALFVDWQLGDNDEAVAAPGQVPS